MEPVIVKCVVCCAMVPEVRCVAVYREPVCSVCDEEMTANDEENFRRDMADADLRIWDRVADANS